MSVQSTEALQLTAWVGSRHVIKDLIYEAYHAFQVSTALSIDPTPVAMSIQVLIMPCESSTPHVRFLT